MQQKWRKPYETAKPRRMENVSPEFEEDVPAEKTPEGLIVSLDGYDGPIDLLLTMARDQKVDLRQISILALAEQYLSFVEHAHSLRIEIAADYLVMAAWLAYLKSRLLLPAQPGDGEDEELSGEALAEALAFQLQRLSAMQSASKELFARPRLGLSRLSGGSAAGIERRVQIKWQASLYDVLDAYGAITKRMTPEDYKIKTWPLISTEEAVQRLINMLGAIPEKEWSNLWDTLKTFCPSSEDETLSARSALASTFTAALEMVKQENIDIQQEGLFAPIYIRAHRTSSSSTSKNPLSAEVANDV